jgi:hypothetical protein
MVGEMRTGDQPAVKAVDLHSVFDHTNDVPSTLTRLTTWGSMFVASPTNDQVNVRAGAGAQSRSI